MGPELVRAQLEESLRAHTALLDDEITAVELTEWGSICASAIRAGGAVFFAGNGGSFADAQHLAAELTGKMGRVRNALPGIALGTNSSSMTAIGNDFDFDDVFARECEALASPESVVIGISTSGNSPNILRLAETTKALGLTFLGLTGRSGGALAAGHRTIQVPSDRTERIQEMHILIGHTLCLLIEEELVFSSDASDAP